MTDTPRRLLVSFSGGETSGYMLWYIWENMRDEYDEIVVVFANSTEENEETLEFAAFVALLFSIPIVWVEAVVFHDERKASGHRIVNYETARRNGEAFEDAIKKYGIPNQKYPWCTRELKLNPIKSYLAAIGWPKGSYDTAIGIRADEIDRMSINAKKNRLVYPLVQRRPTTKPKINFWWTLQPFRLGLPGYRGNCKTCWKKSRRKHLTILQEFPRSFDFFERMEIENGQIGPEFLSTAVSTAEGYRRTFCRGNASVADIRADLVERADSFVPADDDAIVYDPDLDTGGGCAESCEIWADEDEEAAA